MEQIKKLNFGISSRASTSIPHSFIKKENYYHWPGFFIILFFLHTHTYTHNYNTKITPTHKHNKYFKTKLPWTWTFLHIGAFLFYWQVSRQDCKNSKKIRFFSSYICGILKLQVSFFSFFLCCTHHLKKKIFFCNM